MALPTRELFRVASATFTGVLLLLAALLVLGGCSEAPPLVARSASMRTCSCASATRWLSTGEVCIQAQLSGTYPVAGTVMLYPPFALYLFAQMSLLPRGPLVGHSARGHRVACVDVAPKWWAWPILAGMAATVPAAASLVYGNTEMWTAAAVAIACRCRPGRVGSS